MSPQLVWHGTLHSKQENELHTLRLTEALRITQLRIIPNGSTAFAGHDTLSQTSPAPFAFQVFCHEMPASKGANATMKPFNSEYTDEGCIQAYDLPASTAYGRLLAFRGTFSSITLAIYGEPKPAIVKPEELLIVPTKRKIAEESAEPSTKRRIVDPLAQTGPNFDYMRNLLAETAAHQSKTVPSSLSTFLNFKHEDLLRADQTIEDVLLEIARPRNAPQANGVDVWSDILEKVEQMDTSQVESMPAETVEEAVTALRELWASVRDALGDRDSLDTLLSCCCNLSVSEQASNSLSSILLSMAECLNQASLPVSIRRNVYRSICECSLSPYVLSNPGVFQLVKSFTEDMTLPTKLRLRQQSSTSDELLKRQIVLFESINEINLGLINLETAISDEELSSASQHLSALLPPILNLSDSLSPEFAKHFYAALKQQNYLDLLWRLIEYSEMPSPVREHFRDLCLCAFRSDEGLAWLLHHISTSEYTQAWFERLGMMDMEGTDEVLEEVLLCAAMGLKSADVEVEVLLGSMRAVALVLAAGESGLAKSMTPAMTYIAQCLTAHSPRFESNLSTANVLNIWSIPSKLDSISQLSIDASFASLSISKLQSIARALSLVQSSAADLPVLERKWSESQPTQAPLLWHIISVLSEAASWLEEHLKLRSYTRSASLGWISCPAHPEYKRLLHACDIGLRCLTILQGAIEQLFTKSEVDEINGSKLESARLSLLVKPVFAIHRIGCILCTQKLFAPLPAYARQIQQQSFVVLESLPSFSTPTMLGRSIASDILEHSIAVDSELICALLAKLLKSDKASSWHRSGVSIAPQLCDFLVVKCDFGCERSRDLLSEIMARETRHSIGLYYALVQSVRKRFDESGVRPTTEDDTMGDWRLGGSVALLCDIAKVPVGKKAIIEGFPLAELRAPRASSRIAPQVLENLQSVLTQLGETSSSKIESSKLKPGRELAPLLVMAQNVLRAGRESPVRRDFAVKRYNDQDFRAQRTSFSSNARLPSQHVDTFVSSEPL